MATVRETGETDVVRAVTARLGPWGPQVQVGPGDDAAVLGTPDGRVVATVDVLVEGVHFRRDWSSAYDVGVKAAAANLADVAAMGARPSALLVGLVAPGDLPAQWVLELADGLREEAARTGAQVIGGDTVGGPLVVVSVTALGDLGGRAPVLRSGARAGDQVVVTGPLGGSAAGLALLAASAGAAGGPLVDAYRRPHPAYNAGPALADLGATAMCDVSDGLVQDLGRLCASSGVQAVVDVDAVPRPDGASQDDVLHGGEDHALLATVPGGTDLRGLATVVGSIQEGAGVVDADGRPLLAEGFRHFARP